ncbi:MAG: alpha-E domain-containing protein [Dysgonamonadaceae bacterium]
MRMTSIHKKNNAISPVKANRLYWMGRYAQRVYLTLHILRKHYDSMIDEDFDAYKSYCIKMGISDKYTSCEDFVEKYLFMEDNPDSVINMLERLNDNAILLREEITSETLSYIHLAINAMKSFDKNKQGIEGFQFITDWILAFWGSADERICDPSVRKTIFFGKFVESSDMLIRFEYPLDRLIGLCGRIKECLQGGFEMYDEAQLKAFEGQLYIDTYKSSKSLAYLNAIFTA